jgi:hypothetical protein
MGVNVTRQFPKGDLWGSFDKALAGFQLDEKSFCPVWAAGCSLGAVFVWAATRERS